LRGWGAHTSPSAPPSTLPSGTCGYSQPKEETRQEGPAASAPKPCRSRPPPPHFTAPEREKHSRHTARPPPSLCEWVVSSAQVAHTPPGAPPSTPPSCGYLGATGTQGRKCMNGTKQGIHSSPLPGWVPNFWPKFPTKTGQRLRERGRDTTPRSLSCVAKFHFYNTNLHLTVGCTRFQDVILPMNVFANSTDMIADNEYGCKTV